MKHPLKIRLDDTERMTALGKALSVETRLEKIGRAHV